MALPQSFEAFKTDYEKAWNEYVRLHKELDTFRGLEINEHNVGTINAVITKLQDQWSVMYGACHYMAHRGKDCNTAMAEHQKFMAMIKETGAEPENSREAQA